MYCIDLHAMTGSTALRWLRKKKKNHCPFFLLCISRSIGIRCMLSHVYPLIGKPNYIFPRSTIDDICVRSFIRLIIWNVFMILLLAASKLYRMCQLLIKIPLLVIRSTLWKVSFDLAAPVSSSSPWLGTTSLPNLLSVVVKVLLSILP